MTNVICYTQDLPGERDWLRTEFPDHEFLETESSGLWHRYNATDNNFLLEIPYSDRDRGEIPADRIKTVFACPDSLTRLFYDQTWTQTDQQRINPEIKFAAVDPDRAVDRYMMLTFSRCGTMFAESILQQRYQRLHPHYGLDLEPEKMAVEFQDPDLLLCMMYRRDWWRWAVSITIGEDHGCHHYDSKVDWASLYQVTIDKHQLDQLETRVFGIFNFWCNIRLLYPQHQVKLFTCEGVTGSDQNKTTHRKIDYDSAGLVKDYEESKQLFESEYLQRWQMMEHNALSHLANMQVSFTDIV